MPYRHNRLAKNKKRIDEKSGYSQEAKVNVAISMLSGLKLLPSKVPWSLVGEDVALGLGFGRSPYEVSMRIRALRWCVLVYEEVGHGGDLGREGNVVMDATQ